MVLFQGLGLKELRLAAGYTQADLALELGYKSAQFISNIENGKASIPNDEIPAMAEILGIKTKDLASLKLLDVTLKLAADCRAPDLKKYAREIANFEKDLMEKVSNYPETKKYFKLLQSS